MNVCDDIIANSDRHWRNFGIIRNVETLECRMAPIFDSGTCLWCTKSTVELAKKDYSFEGRQFDCNPGKQLLLAKDLSWFEASDLEGFAEEACKILERNEKIADRLKHIERGLQNRIDRMTSIRKAL